MISDIRSHLDAKPFLPFSIVMSSGQSYRVASPDHANINPKQTRVVIFFDDDSSVIISTLHIATVVQESGIPV